LSLGQSLRAFAAAKTSVASSDFAWRGVFEWKSAVNRGTRRRLIE
jgi:hypothetical protein